MKFSTKEDIEIAIEDVFKALCDFDGYERAIMRHGIDVARTDSLPEIGVGATWHATGELRGKHRDINVEMTEYSKPNSMRFQAVSNGMEASFLIELVALSLNRTRMRVELDVKPKTLPARLLMQSARLAKNTLNRRYKKRVANFAEDLEDRHVRGLNV